MNIIDSIRNSITPMHPYNKVTVLSSVSNTGAVLAGELAEVESEAKIVGQYLGICEVVEVNSEDTDKLSPGDLVLIWDTAIKDFDLPSPLGSISLAKTVDIFAKIDPELRPDLVKLLGK